MMTSTPAEKVKYLNETKVAIKDAIVAKGVEVAEGATFRSYADSIAAIDTALPEQEKTLEVTENGEYEVSPDEGYVISKVVATVNVPTGGGGGEVEPIVLTGGCSYACAGPIASTYIALYGDTISTSNVTLTDHMFYKYSNGKIPFEINLNKSVYQAMGHMFYESKIEELPVMFNGYPNNMANMFAYCEKLKSIPENHFDTWDFSYLNGGSNQVSYIFWRCCSLRNIPSKLLSCLYNSTTSIYSKVYYYGFSECYSLDEINGLVVDNKATITSNMFNSTFTQCGRLKNMTFEVNEDGSVKTANWKSQVINLGSVCTGYHTSFNFTQNGFTADKEVKDDETYQALKNDPDWFSKLEAYSRYNHDSAVATINSLPDTSAYLATQSSGTNTIKFRGAAGELTDGGAINTLTEEEIAVATAKGWTVTLV